MSEYLGSVREPGFDEGAASGDAFR